LVPNPRVNLNRQSFFICNTLDKAGSKGTRFIGRDANEKLERETMY